MTMETPAASTGTTTPSNAKSTVKKRSGSSKSATQRFLPMAEIRNDTVVLKNGGLRGILQIEALNFNLKSETEQKGIIAGYQSFVNTLEFPVQIVLRSTKINIDPYLDQLLERAKTQQNPLLKEQTLEYVKFVERIVDMADIMQKRFFVVVPLDETPNRPSVFTQFLSWMGLDDTAGKALKRHRMFQSKITPLRDRMHLVETGLNNIGLATHVLNTKELIELFYHIYNPEVSQEQKLSKISDLNTEELTL